MDGSGYFPITTDLDEHLAAELRCGFDRPIYFEWTVVDTLSLSICLFLLAVPTDLSPRFGDKIKGNVLNTSRIRQKISHFGGSPSALFSI